MMTPDPIALTRDLIRIPSPTGDEAAVTAFARQILTDLGWQVVTQPVSPGRDNLYATRAEPVVVFSTHLDTVPGGPPIAEDAETLWGRGAVDAKGIAACMIAAAEQLAQGGDDRIGLLFVVGEEDGSDGAIAAQSLEPRGRFLVNGEPTENRLAIGQKGTLRVRLHATGRAGHSGYPDLGVSAVDPLLDALHALRNLPLPSHTILGQSTLNVGQIHGGVAPNVIPPHAGAECLIRTVEPTRTLRREIQQAIEPTGVEVTFPLEIDPIVAPPLSGWPTIVVSYTSDLPLLANWGTGYQLGPGSIAVAHTDEERVAKDDLRAGVDAYVALARDLLNREIG